MGSDAARQQVGLDPSCDRRMRIEDGAIRLKLANVVLEMGGNGWQSGTRLGDLDGPFVEVNEVIGGYVVVTAASYERALEVARECPGLIAFGSSCEIREIA